MVFYSFLAAVAHIAGQYKDDYPFTICLDSGEEQTPGAIYTLACADVTLGSIRVKGTHDSPTYTPFDLPFKD